MKAIETELPRICPMCENRTLRFIEVCESSEGEEKTAWTCDFDKHTCDTIIYIYRFEGTREGGGG